MPGAPRRRFLTQPVSTRPLLRATGVTEPIEHNRRAWDRRAEQGRRFARPVGAEELERAAQQIDGWAAAEGVAGKRVLCLGAGGGRQGPLYAAAGGSVTVVDVSERQLELDRQVAAAHRLDIRTVRASLDDLSALETASFDLIIQPVSTCYIPDLAPAHREAARILRPSGAYISQHKQPASLQGDVRRAERGYELVEPYNRPTPLPEVVGSPHREPGTLEYIHGWERLIGWMCRAGFVIENLSEPDHADRTTRPGTFGDRSRFLPPYVRIQARRVKREDDQPARNSIVIP